MKFLLSKTGLYIALCAAIAASAFWAGRASVAANNAASVKNASATNKSAASNNAALSASLPGAGASLNDLLNAKGKPDGDLLANWAKNLTPEETAAALKSLQGLPAGLQRNAILSAVVNAWAERDPQGFLSSNTSVTVPRMREGGMDTALHAWASQDPKAALDWLKANPGSATPAALQQRYTAAIAGYASTDPQGALATVAGLSENSATDVALKNNALIALTNSLADSGNFSDAITMFGQLPAGQYQTTAYNTLVQRWAETSPVDASAWISSLTDPTQRNQLGARVAQTWAASDPAAAAAWAAQADQQAMANPAGTGGQSSQLLANVISSWATYDLDAPAQYLNQLPAGAAKDGAVAIFATRAGQEDASSAIQWVGTITDDQVRSRAATAVAFEMMQQDPNSYNAFMANTTLLNDQQKTMLSNIPPQLASRIGMAMAGGGFGGGGPGGGAIGATTLDTSSSASPVNGFQSRFDNAILNGGGPFNGGGPGGGGFGGPGGGGGGGFGGQGGGGGRRGGGGGYGGGGG